VAWFDLKKKVKLKLFYLLLKECDQCVFTSDSDGSKFVCF
jgi:hypothetical protein